MMRPKRSLPGMLAVLFVAFPSRAEEAKLPTLEQAFVRQAPAVLAHVKKAVTDRSRRNVGVLKFLVNKDGKKTSDNVGTLNLLLARRLELALILANDIRDPVGILRNASAVAARTKGASHTSAAGRDRLFSARYPLAWGDREVEAGAFVTGVASVSDDLKTMTVRLLAFDRTSNELAPLGKDFQVRNSATRLGEMGESFVLRGQSAGETVELTDEDALDQNAVQSAAQVKQQKQANPLDPRKSRPPVTLEVRYDGKAVPIEYRNGKAFIPEPKEGQKVTLVLRRDGSKERYGVVLKVNGESTVRRQKLPDLQCRRWILDPGIEPVTIRGYQIDEELAEEFKVLSVAESKEREVNYGTDVGTITMTVFRERRGEDPPEPEGDDRYALAISRGRLPGERDGKAKPPGTPGALKKMLLEDASAGRGLIAEGEIIGSRVQKVKFNPDPVPVMSATIVYYTP